jgi:large subunit ribosomal protein L10
LKKEQKEEFVRDFRRKLDRAEVAMVSTFVGLNVGQINTLRRDLRHADSEMKVVKNNLIKLAAKGTPCEKLEDLFVGPNALVLGYKDPVASARILVRYSETHPALTIKGGILQGKWISAAEVASLSRLPAREVLLAQLLGLLKGPQRNFASLLAAVPRQLLHVLKAKAEKCTDYEPMTGGQSEAKAEEAS